MLKNLLKPVPDLPISYLITARSFESGLKVHYYVPTHLETEPVEVYTETTLRGELIGSLDDWIAETAKKIYRHLKTERIPIACGEMYEASQVFSVEYTPGTLQYLAVSLRSDEYDDFPWRPENEVLPVYTRRGGEEITSDEIMTVFGYTSWPIRALVQQVEKPGRLVVVNDVSVISFTPDAPPTQNYMAHLGLPHTGVFYLDCVEIENLLSKGIKCRLNSI